MSYASEHTLKVVLAKYSRGGTEYNFLDAAFGVSSMMLFQPHDDLMGNSKFDDIQILVGLVRSDGNLIPAARLIGYSDSGHDGALLNVIKKRVTKLNGETAYRIIRAINRTRAAHYWDDPDRWRDAAHFDFKPTLNAYVQEQLIAGTGPVQYSNRMGGPNAAKQVFESALRISKKNKTKNSAEYSRHVVTTGLEISTGKFEELLTLYNLREQSI